MQVRAMHSIELKKNSKQKERRTCARKYQHVSEAKFWRHEQAHQNSLHLQSNTTNTNEIVALSILAQTTPPTLTCNSSRSLLKKRKE